MPCRIQKLAVDVSTKLKAQPHIISVASVIRELIQNAVDANSTSITILINFKKLSVLVQDNGDGLAPEELKSAGTLHFTSKISKLDDLVRNKKFGFRGEALFNMSSVAKLTMISKCKTYNSTWIKTFHDNDHRILTSEDMSHINMNADNLQFSKDLNNSGTIVSVEDIFYNLPVRRSMFTKSSQLASMNEIKNDIFQIVISNPNINISVYDVSEIDEEISLEILENITRIINFKRLDESYKLSSSMIYSLCYQKIFDSTFSKSNFKKVGLRFRDYKLEGVISRIATTSKYFKFLFINGKRYNNKSYFKSIDQLFQSFGFGGENDLLHASQKSLRKQYSKYPIMILNIQCQLELSDHLQDPSKDIFEVSKKSIIEPLINEAMHCFLIRQGYAPPNSNTSSQSSEGNDESQSMISRNGTYPEPDTETFGNKSLQILFKSKQISGKIEKKEIKGRYRITNAYINTATKISSSNGYSHIPFKIANLNNDSYFVESKTLSRNLITKIPSGFNSKVDKLNEKFTTLTQNSNIRKDELENFHVINQIDNKFILTTLPDRQSTNNYSIVIFDQHACDERIKLEEYLQAYMTDVFNQCIEVESVTNMNIEISGSEESLSAQYKKEFQYWGIIFETEQVSKTKFLLKILQLPKYLFTKKLTNLNYLKSAIIKHIQDLQMFNKSKIGSMIPNKSTHHWSMYLNYIPDLIMDLFNTKACRSAIMFGDSLNLNECALLIKLLSKCQFPFKCAHGRPSFFPILQYKDSLDVSGHINEKSVWNEDYLIE